MKETGIKVKALRAIAGTAFMLPTVALLIYVLNLYTRLRKLVIKL